MKKLISVLPLTIVCTFWATGANPTNPSITYLQDTYGISQQEAERRIDLQQTIISLSESLNTKNDPNYGDMYIQQEPVYKIVLLFTDNKDRLDFIKSLDPKLQRWVQVKQAKRSRDTYIKELESINELLRNANILFASKYDLESQKYIISVESKSDINVAKKALQGIGLQGDFTVKVGGIPSIETVSGSKTGDKIYGGQQVWTTWDSASNKHNYNYCSLGYGVSYTSAGVTKKGVVTAGHCKSPVYLNLGGRVVTLSNPIVQKIQRDTSDYNKGDGINDKYDYQIWDVTGLDINNQIQYKDLNGIPEFPSSGIMNLTSITTFMNQKKGMVVCKSGVTTGITCGTITNGNATHDGVAGWIEVGNSKQANLSSGGDSGGPWFLYPGTSSNITGVGIHTAGNREDYPTDFAIYMPIDYIDDHISSVNTIKTK